MTRDEEVANFAIAPLRVLDQLLEVHTRAGNTRTAGIIRDAQQHHGATQTTELAHCGRLFPHNETITDHNGLPIRAVTRFTGDIGAFMAPFMSGATIGRIDRDAGKRFETVALSGNERAQVVSS